MKDHLSLFLFALLFSGCISGPVDSEKTFAEKLSGDSYKGTHMPVQSGLIPINMVRKDIQRKFAGKVFCDDGIGQRPAVHALIELVEDKVVLASVSSQVDGSYQLVASTESTGPFILRGKAKCGFASRRVSGKLDERIPSYDLLLQAAAKKSP